MVGEPQGQAENGRALLYLFQELIAFGGLICLIGFSLTIGIIATIIFFILVQDLTIQWVKNDGFIRKFLVKMLQLVELLVLSLNVFVELLYILHFLLLLLIKTLIISIQDGDLLLIPLDLQVVHEAS